MFFCPIAPTLSLSLFRAGPQSFLGDGLRVWSGWQLPGGGAGFERAAAELEAVLALRVVDADGAVRAAARHCLLDLEARRPASASKVAARFRKKHAEGCGGGVECVCERERGRACIERESGQARARACGGRVVGGRACARLCTAGFLIDVGARRFRR